MSEANNAPEPKAEPDTRTSEDWDTEFQNFLGHTFDDLAPQENAGDETTPAPAGDETVSAGGGDDTIDASTAAPNAETPAGDNADAVEQPDPDAIDPADLAAMTGLAAPVTPKEEPAPEAAPAEASAGGDDDDQPFMPFQPTFKLPPQTMAALFESEDAETRHQALVGLLTNFGNTITQIADRRAKEQIAAAQTRFATESRVAGVRQAILGHFYSENEDLAPYKPAVDKAFEIVAKKDPKRPYTPELAAEVSKLARAALKASGVNLPGKAKAAPATPQKAPPSKAPGNGFDSSGSRPAASSSADNSPGALLDEFTQF